MGTAIEYKGGPNVPVRFLWRLFVGWWVSALWTGLMWLAQLTVIGIPIAVLLLNRTRFGASVYRD